VVLGDSWKILLGTRMFILRSARDVIDIINAVFQGFYAFPTGWQALFFQRMRPMSSLSVV
ncbi:hypothetical protein SK128_019644, partial [Halocaridina rubra]